MVKDTGSGGQGVRVWGVGQSGTFEDGYGEKQGERKGKQAKGLLGEVKRERNDEETNSFLWKYRRYN